MRHSLIDETRFIKYIFGVIIALTVLFQYNIIHSASAYPNIWSFEFSNCTLLEVIDEISRKTGVEITSNRAIEGTVGKMFIRNNSLAGILNRLFIRDNRVIFFNYNKDKLLSVQIFFIDKDLNEYDENILTQLNHAANQNNPQISNKDGAPHPGNGNIRLIPPTGTRRNGRGPLVSGNNGSKNPRSTGWNAGSLGTQYRGGSATTGSTASVTSSEVPPPTPPGSGIPHLAAPPMPPGM